nr:hypothetical protein [Rhizobium leguminosarum]
MPGTMNGGGKTPPSTEAMFEDALAKLPDGYVDGILAAGPGA